MWTEMPKLGWMSSSQTQTISKFPWLRNSHITFKSKSSRGKGTSQCGTEGATSAYQGSEFDVFFVFFCVLCLTYSMMCLCIFDVSSHQAPGIGSTIDLSCLVANVELIQLWCPMKRIVCALMKLHNLARVQWFCCFFRIFLLDSIVSKGLVASIC